jgi:integrase
MQNKRITVRAVENLVKKYSTTVTSLKNITPHKLRSTYGTSLYRETGDIYLVADVLGHKDVNTTRKHYAALEEDRRRKAAKAVTLREKLD